MTGQHWTKEQLQKLRYFYEGGMSIHTIVIATGKTASSIHHKAIRLGLKRKKAKISKYSLAIIEKLEEWKYPALIAKELGISKSSVTYHIKQIKQWSPDYIIPTKLRRTKKQISLYQKNYRFLHHNRIAK